MCVDGSRIWKEKVMDSKISGYEWTGPKAPLYRVEKNKSATNPIT